MKPLTDENVPPLTIVGTFFYDFAELMLDFHNVMAKAEDEDDYVRYIRVLKFDGELRSLCTEKIPTCLSPRTPHDPNWPRWVGWARRLYQTNVNHKLIMIHQAYLSKSFKDLRYTYSRWACSTCSKNIINLYNTREPDEPQWWVEHGYIVTAAICLILDLFQRTTADPEVLEHQACVRRSISYLQHFPTSSVAIHGVRLLVSLLQEYAKIQEGSKTAVTPGSIWNYVPSSCTNAGDIPLPGQARVPQPMQPEWELPILQEDAGTFNFDSIDALGFDDLTEYMPTDGISNAVFFDNIYSANGQFNW
ncbi:hypothetical protein T440DRAFT_12461 [Plenodomus tracheiphilus IPT5]|uniref:Transcription factor domain-containing protein n=1 Tax=Plenodomus tracheiphilus IPT5 TaxID=1408161 RepID=A0A6A7BN46_9PLEO|nr:hypothetical protein T440DRAFT_12461 [Plenodomus tracheiphilus IPT5]